MAQGERNTRAEDKADSFNSRSALKRINERATSELPLAIETYPQQLREDTLQAIEQVAMMAPLLLTPLNPKSPASLILPERIPRLIAIYGKKRTGKTSLADYIVRNYASVIQIDFSSVIIEEINDYLATWKPWSEEPSKHIIDDANKADPRYRSLLQMWAQGRRFENPRYWLEKLNARCAEMQGDNRLILMAGLREPAEKEEIERLNGEVWKVTRPNLPEDKDKTSLHINETALDGTADEEFARVIINESNDLSDWEGVIKKTLHEYD